MHIERVQVEEGFLDGIDVALSPGLNVIIGARGTGKTSLIELIRFCLDVRGYTTDTDKRSRDHALSVLGSGQVTVTLSDGNARITVTRTANDSAPRASGPFSPPIIMSQGDIEEVGLQTGGRLRLLDTFLGDRRRTDTEEAAAAAEVRSLTAEVEALRREMEGLEHQLSDLPSIEKQLADLAPAEQQVSKTSAEAAQKKQQLDSLSASISSLSVGVDAIDRCKQAIVRWRSTLGSAARAAPTLEAWAAGAGADPLVSIRARVRQAQDHLSNALTELAQAESEISAAASAAGERKLTVEGQARELRRAIEALQKGAGAIVQQGQHLRERKAQLVSLAALLTQRRASFDATIQRRGVALDRLESIREQRFKARSQVARELTDVLGPRIRIGVARSAQFAALSAAIAHILRGSGLHYAELSRSLAERVSPRELLEATDRNAFAFVADAASISTDRAARLLAQFRESDLGTFATVAVEDSISLQLLDGQAYKDILDLSTGQRCTVVLPLILRHTDRVLTVDQPEDHIDNAFIVDTLVKAILSRGQDSQIIFSTHNANIPVLGNADRVLQLGSDGRRGFVVAAAQLEDPAIVAAISAVMEGGAEAFARRASFYSKHGRR